MANLNLVANSKQCIMFLWSVVSLLYIGEPSSHGSLIWDLIQCQLRLELSIDFKKSNHKLENGFFLSRLFSLANSCTTISAS